MSENEALTSPPDREPKERKVQIVRIDATQAEYQPGLKTFSGVEEAMEQHPALQKLLQESYSNSDVVVRGIHRFAASPEQQEEIIAELSLQGTDRPEGKSVHTGEHFHVGAAFMHDQWQRVMAYTTEFEGQRKPKEMTRSFGVLLIYDNSDSLVVYADYETREVYSKKTPPKQPVEMGNRDDNMAAVIASQEGMPHLSWKERLHTIVIIEYPFIPREPGFLDKMKGALQGFGRGKNRL